MKTYFFAFALVLLSAQTTIPTKDKQNRRQTDTFSSTFHRTIIKDINAIRAKRHIEDISKKASFSAAQKEHLLLRLYLSQREIWYYNVNGKSPYQILMKSSDNRRTKNLFRSFARLKNALKNDTSAL